SLALSITLAGVSVLIPLAASRAVTEQDMRLQTHEGALTGFHLDVLLGLVPLKLHGAERTIRREHESLLVDWLSTARSRLVWMLGSSAVRSAVITILSAFLVYDYIRRAGTIQPGLFVYWFWIMLMPGFGEVIAGALQAFIPARNSFVRVTEPLRSAERP